MFKFTFHLLNSKIAQIVYSHFISTKKFFQTFHTLIFIEMKKIFDKQKKFDKTVTTKSTAQLQHTNSNQRLPKNTNQHIQNPTQAPLENQAEFPAENFHFPRA